MRSQSLVLTVLPLTIRKGARFHVSLHIAPRLVPEGAEEPLSAFGEFSDWGTVAHAVTYQLLGKAGPIGATARRERVDPALWAKVFPPTTPVRAPRFDPLANRQWRSFPVRTVHDIAGLLPLLGTLFFPLDPPDLKTWVQRGGRGGRAASDVKSPVAAMIGRLGKGDGTGDAALTARLDKAPGTSPLAADNPWKSVLEPLHAARRFYERPEAQREYHDEPKKNLAPTPVPRPDPDFHERVAHLADQPELLRQLGLVIDLEVTDLAALKAATELRASIGVSGNRISVIAALTPVSHVGERVLTVSRSGDWLAGRLRLGDTARYAVLAMDSDGAALKAERYLRSLPRMQAMADNGDPGDIAPPALRSEGFTVVQNARLAAVQAQLAEAGKMVAKATPAAPPSVRTEDVTRGYRVEIWDDHAKAWFSPHRRLATATVGGVIRYTDLPEYGQVQTAAVGETPGVTGGPVHLHEAMFGWSGWSLSAPRPGPRAEPFIGDGKPATPGGKPLPNDGKQHEIAIEPRSPADPISPVEITTRVEPFTLPRLRYGRSYMFRAWSVDLAGNSPGDPVLLKPAAGPAPAAGPVPAASPAAAPALGAATGTAPAIERFRPGLARLATAAPRPIGAVLPGAIALARTALRAPANGAGTIAALQAVAAAPPPLLTGAAGIDAIAMARLQSRPAAAPAAAGGLAGPIALDAALASLSLDTAAPRAASLDAVIAKDIIVDAGGVGAIDPGVFVDTADKTISPLVPFRRWDPVPPPVVVARHRFSIAESIHHLVIRSGVVIAADGKGGEATTVVAPAAFIANTPPALAADFRATSERHLAAPKGSQVLNELHGRFDPALGKATDAERRTMLCAALRDDGTLFDTRIASLDDPDATIPQPGVRLEAGPEVANPVTDLATLQDDNRGNPPPVGHYVVHDFDAMALPWLPDPLAAGVALGMNTANRGSPLVGAFRVESTAARYAGDWPAPAPFRLVLESAAAPGARVAGGVITVGLPPGSRLDLRLSSSLDRADLPLFAVWSALPAVLTALDLYARPAADGQFWALTPTQPISLVHAVPRPVLPPLTTAILPLRAPAETGANFAAVIDVHAASTDRIDAEASWSEWADDLTAPGPVREPHQALPFHAQVDVDEDMVLFGVADDSFPLPGVGSVRVHRARHEFGDTRHRVVDYAFRATTRFREYFPTEMLATRDSRSVVGAPTRISLPSTAAPPAPVVDSVIPLFRWDEVGDPGQPFGIRRRRRGGLRVYLRRPWFRSGDDEQLAVILASNAEAAGVHGSVWGSDPVWFNAGPPSPVVGLSIEDLYGASGVDDVRGPDPRLSPLVFLTGPKGALVSAIGYRPQYNPDRKLWYVDVAIEPAASVWAFVRLAVARYQPNSLPGLELSPITLCDFTQLPPERTLTVSRPDATTVRVTVSGPAGLREAAPKPAVVSPPPPPPSPVALPGSGNLIEPASSLPIAPGRLGAPGPYPFGAADATLAMAKDRRVYAALEHRPAGLVSDLDWETVERHELSLGGLSPTGEFAWTGILHTGVAIGPAEPGRESHWRVTVEEHEAIEGDAADPKTTAPLVKQWRLIYADRTLL